MGQRITIDSASMFNKALELIETSEYFGVSPSQTEVLVHPESLVHAMVGFKDGALMAHVGPHDMRHAIGYALHWPERKTSIRVYAKANFKCRRNRFLIILSLFRNTLLCLP